MEGVLSKEEVIKMEEKGRSIPLTFSLVNWGEGMDGWMGRVREMDGGEFGLVRQCASAKKGVGVRREGCRCCRRQALSL